MQLEGVMSVRIIRSEVSASVSTQLGGGVSVAVTDGSEVRRTLSFAPYNQLPNCLVMTPPRWS